MPLMSDGARSTDHADRAGTGDLHALRGRLTGGLVLPGDPEWDDARRAWNLAVDQRPVAVALVESVEDVVKVVEFAGEHGLRIAPQGTGHGASALAVLDGTILVKTSRLRGVENRRGRGSGAHPGWSALGGRRRACRRTGLRRPPRFLS